MNNQFEQKDEQSTWTKILNNQFGQKCQFAQKHRQLVRTKLSTNILKKQNVTMNYQHSIWTKRYQQPIWTQISTIKFEQRYQNFM